MLLFLLLLPLAAGVQGSPGKGLGPAFCDAISEPDTLAAIRLSLIAAAIAVPLNTVFGIAAAWAIAKFDFPRQDISGHIDRSALFGFAGGVGPDLCAGVRPAGLVRPVAGGSRHPYPVRLAGHRAGDHLRHLSLCGARTDPADERSGPRRRGGRRCRWARRALAHFCASPCPTSNGACSTACCCAMRARWANSARCRWCRAISAARPTPCRCMWSCSTTITIMSAHLPWRRCWRCWRWSPWRSNHCWNGVMRTRWPPSHRH